MAELGYTYPPKPSLHFKELGRRLFWILLIYIEVTFKQLKKYGRTRVLHPLNPKYDDIELSKDTEYRVVGVVIEKKKNYR